MNTIYEYAAKEQNIELRTTLTSRKTAEGSNAPTHSFGGCIPHQIFPARLFIKHTNKKATGRENVPVKDAQRAALFELNPLRS